MSFFSKALRKAEVFLEQVDESVAQASRRLVVEGAVGEVEDSEISGSEIDGTLDEETNRRSKSIPRARGKRSRSRNSFAGDSQTNLKEAGEILENVGEGGSDEQRKGGEGQESDGLQREASRDGVWDDEGSQNDASDVDETKMETENEDVATGESKALEKAEQSSETRSEEREPKSTASEIPADSHAEAAGASADEQTHERVSSVTASDKSTPAAKVGASQKNALQKAGNKTGGSTSHEKAAKRDSAVETRSNGEMTEDSSNGAKRESKEPSLKMDKRAVSERGTAEEANGGFVEALEAENDALRDELENVENELSSLRAERSRLIKNLKRLKEVTTELDESLRQKSSDARHLEQELNSVRDAAAVLEVEKKKFAGEQRTMMDKLSAKLNKEIDDLSSKLKKAEATCESLTSMNAEMQEKLTLGRLNDAATADDARKEADTALSAYETEVQRHQKTREEWQRREAELESKAALAASALAAAERTAEESNSLATQMKAKLRTMEAQLKREVEARDAALARIVDLERAVEQAGIGHGEEQRDKLEQLQETVPELENALEAKNVELSRLKAECEVLRKKATQLEESSSNNKISHEQRTSSEVETQLRNLADEAFRKQSALESLRGENRALAHQLEMERKRAREAQAMAAAQHSIRGGVKGILDADLERGMREGPMARLRVPRRWPKPVEKTLRNLDLTTTRILLLLRKEPWLRIGFLLYVAGMNIFIYIILHWHIGMTSEEPAHAAEAVEVQK